MLLYGPVVKEEMLLKDMFILALVAIFFGRTERFLQFW